MHLDLLHSLPHLTVWLAVSPAYHARFRYPCRLELYLVAYLHQGMQSSYEPRMYVTDSQVLLLMLHTGKTLDSNRCVACTRRISHHLIAGGDANIELNYIRLLTKF
jgi:hypothetical protein